MRSCPYAYFVLGKINLLQIWYRGFHNFFFFLDVRSFDLCRLDN
jgi:hypothetical protein